MMSCLFLGTITVLYCLNKWVLWIIVAWLLVETKFESFDVHVLDFVHGLCMWEISLWANMVNLALF